jgi:signal peptidase I|tara:strand:+ start:9696 stop:10151 length:456 start_codon:yes stop_codon:yes gene_type:complete
MKLGDKKDVRLFVLLCVLCVVFSAGYRLFIVWGQSMSPTFINGQLIIVDKNHYKMFDPKVNDIVVLKDTDEGGYMIKRIIALPKDEVEIIRGVIFVNKEKISTDSISSYIGTDLDWGPVILEKDFYFYFGDNRSYTAWGVTHKSNILYKKR